MGNVNYSEGKIQFNNTGNVFFYPDLDLWDFRYMERIVGPGPFLPPVGYAWILFTFGVKNYDLKYTLLAKSGVEVFEKFGIYVWDNIHHVESNAYEIVVGSNINPDSYVGNNDEDGHIVYYTSEDDLGIEIFGKAFAIANGITFVSQIKSFTITE